MNKWDLDKELYSEIAGYAGDSADAFFELLHKWQSSIPPFRDSLTYSDVIEQSKTTKVYGTKWLPFVAAGVAAIVIMSVLIFNIVSQKATYKPAICKAVIGDVHIIRDSKVINLVNGMELLQSDTIVCGKESMAVIEVGSATVRIDQNSEVTIDTLQQTQVLSLAASMNKGILYAAVKKLYKGDSLLVKTKTAVAGVRGTTFLIQSDSRLTKLIVVDGKVLLAPRVAGVPPEQIHGIAVDAGKSCVIDTKTLESIQQSVEEKKIPLDQAIQQLIPVSTADEKAIQALNLIRQNIVQDVVIDTSQPQSLNNLSPIVAIIPYKNDLIATTNTGLYYCGNNIVKWKHEFPVFSKPFIWNDYIIIQSTMLQALDTTGTITWQLDIEGNVIYDGIIPVRDTIVVPTTKGLVYFIHKNGSIVHKINCNAPIVAKPVLFGQMVCVATADGYLYAIDVVLGVSIYRKYIGQVVPNGIFGKYPEIYTVAPSSIQKIHLLKDEIVWKYSDSEIVAAVEHPQGIIFATKRGTLGKISGNGNLQWQISPGKDIHSLQYTSKGIIFIAESVFYQMSDTGEVLWSYTLPVKNTEVLSIGPQTVYIRIENSYLVLRL
ncbi:MAG: PQQ-binding-like beta-propeller repeat protein [Spirochaetes bacterium]|nr:PQQ-binding-like beta-propeller repeat protein [Spirochaetota bacterium]